MKKVLVLLVAITMVITLFAVRPLGVNAAGFKDVGSDYWAKDQIDYLVSKGVIAGFPDGTFKPEDPVTREQFAKMICIAKKLSEYKPTTPTFKDVPQDRWSYGFIEAAVKAGYIKGYADGTFKPANSITRQELAVLGVRVLGKGAEAEAFKGEPIVWANDWKKIASWAAGAVTLAYRPDIQILTYHMKEGTVDPTMAATRAECAYAIYKIVVPPQAGGQVVIAQTQEPDALMSFATSMMAQRNIAMQYEDGLIMEFPNGTLAPRMALNVPNFKDGTWTTFTGPDGKTWMKTTYYLRKGVKWSDGVPVNYEQDIKFAVYDIYLSGKIEQIPSTDPYDKIDKIEFPNPYTMVVTWKDTTPYANAGLPIYPKHFWSQVPLEQITSSDLAKKPIHAGPYKIEQWVEGSYISLVPNPNWFGWAGSKPLIQRFVYQWIPDTNTMLMNVLAGKVDLTLIGLGIKEAQQAEKIPTIKVQRIPSTFWEHLEINTTDPILSDVRVRKALAYGIDYNDLNNRVFLGQRTVMYYPYIGLFNEFYRNPKAVLPKYDPAMANKLLDDAGWKMGSDGYRYKDGKKLTLELSTTTRQDRKDEAVVLQAQLKKIGIDIQTKFLSASYFFGTYTTHRMFQLAMFAWGGDPFDPDGFELYHSSQIPTEANGWQGQNYPGISDPTLDDAIYKATHEVDPYVRQKNYYIAEQRIADLVPQIGLNVWTDIYTPKKGLAMAGFDYVMSSSVGYTYNSELWYWEKK
ncbi:MAG: ABC transporter substrate-binding protein [Caldisericum sp.]|uniref:ABC transporter substrate-binding protein n=1 Tax=Caldisericum sp. TaxID=2499687 RepID=UPI003D0B2490